MPIRLTHQLSDIALIPGKERSKEESRQRQPWGSFHNANLPALAPAFVK
jgi:hypothetical protein